jgi:hypothetical protein
MVISSKRMIAQMVILPNFLEIKGTLLEAKIITVI